METGRGWEGSAHAFAGLPTAQDLDLSPPRRARHQTLGLRKTKKPGVKRVDRREGRRGYCSEPGQEAEAELALCK